MAEYYNVTTTIGDAEIAKAIATNTKLNITHIVFGDGNGSVPTPSKTRTTLVKEVFRQPITKYERHPNIGNWIIIETILPSNIGGFWIREMGVIANGKLISHGSHAPFEKVADPTGVSEYRLKFTLDIRDGNVVAITLDQSLIYATQAWVEENYIKRVEIVDDLVSDVSNKPLSAKQGKYLQDNKIDRAIKIPENADLNDYKKEGTYFVDYNLIAQTIKNCPTQLAFTVKVDVTAGFVQRLTTYKDAGTLQYIRSQYTGEWTPWYKTYSELDPQPTVDAIDNLKSTDVKKPLSANQGRALDEAKFDKAGGILTGEININTGESSPIKTVINKSSSITTNSPTELASIIHALSFGWYQSEWQIGNVRSGSQASAGFGVTLGNSNLRFLINGNGTSNYGTFDSVGNITAPMVIGKLQGRVKTEATNYNSDQAFLDKYTSGDSSSFFFDNGGGNKHFTQFSVGVSASLQDGGYFLLGASPLDNKVKAMSGVKDASGGYRLQKNLTLLDSESDNILNGSFVWDKHKEGGWARGLIFKGKPDSTTYAGFGGYGTTDTVEKLYMAIGGDNVWSNGNGKGIWIDSTGAYSNCNWTITGWVSGAFTGVFDGSIVAKDNRNISPAQVGGARMGYYFAEYTGIRYGSVTAATYGDFLAFNGYGDSSGGKANGIFLDKTNHRIYHFQNTFGAKDWGTPREIAYTDNQTFTGHNYFENGIRATNFGLGFKYLAKGISGDSDAGWIGVGADQANAGFLEIGTADDGTEPIFARQYNSGSPSDDGARSTVKNELVLLDANGDTKSSKNIYASSFRSTQDEASLHSTSGRYLFVNSNRWGSFSPASGYIPLSVDCGGTGNGQGIAPSASKLQVARNINNVPFDGTQNITIQDSTAFYANGLTGNSAEFPAWNAKSGVYSKIFGGASANVVHFLGGGSASALQIMAYYANGGLFYRSSRDSVGFEKDFERIVTEGGGTAISAKNLAYTTLINGVGYNGSSDINITAPMRYLGNLNSSTVNNAKSDGFYLVADENGFFGLYGYGILEVRSTGGTINQTYYAHNKLSTGSVAVRQSWDSGQNFSAWRSLDPKGALTLTGAVTGNASFDELGNISIPTNLQVGIGVNQYYQDVTASRISGVVYTNNTGNTIFAIITASGSNNTALTHQVSGVQFVNTNESLSRTISYAIPDGASYMITAAIIYKWSELRR